MGKEIKTAKGFGEKVPKERNHLNDRGLDGRMESEWILG
jgi:hypothetical protein